MSTTSLSASDGAFLLSCLMNATSGGSVNWNVVAPENGYTNPGSAKNRLAALKKMYSKDKGGSYSDAMKKSPKKSEPLKSISPTKSKIGKSPGGRRGRPKKSAVSIAEDDDSTPTPEGRDIKAEVKEEIENEEEEG